MHLIDEDFHILQIPKPYKQQQVNRYSVTLTHKHRLAFQPNFVHPGTELGVTVPTMSLNVSMTGCVLVNLLD